MHINESERGRGLSKIFFATWLHLCYERFKVFRVATRKIDKPVLGLLLQKFFFVSPHGRTIDGKKEFACACKKGGWLALEVSRDPLPAEEAGGCGDAAEIRVWAADQGKLRTVFSKAFQKTQSIEILSDKPLVSTTVHVETCFFLPKDHVELKARAMAHQIVSAAGLELYTPGHESMRCPLSLFELLNRGSNLYEGIPARVWF